MPPRGGSLGPSEGVLWLAAGRIDSTPTLLVGCLFASAPMRATPPGCPWGGGPVQSGMRLGLEPGGRRSAEPTDKRPITTFPRADHAPGRNGVAPRTRLDALGRPQALSPDAFIQRCWTFETPRPPPSLSVWH